MDKGKIVVLVVEDDVLLIKAISTKLSAEEMVILNARSVDEALEFLEPNSSPKPDVVWLDHYLLGDKNGLDLTTKLKSIRETATIPVIVVSNSASTEKIAEYRKIGVYKYIGKAETSLSEIVDTIKEAVKNSNKLKS